MGTAPWSITTRVWSDVPDAMFVSAQAASNCTNNHPCHKLLTRRPYPYFCAIILQHNKFHIFLLANLLPATGGSRFSRGTPRIEAPPLLISPLQLADCVLHTRQILNSMLPSHSKCNLRATNIHHTTPKLCSSLEKACTDR